MRPDREILRRQARRDAATPTGNAMPVIQGLSEEIDAAALLLEEIRDTHLEEVENLLSEPLSTVSPDDFSEITAEFDREIDGIERKLEAELPGRLATERRANFEFMAFCCDRGLDGQVIRKPWPVGLTLAGFALMIVIESFANGYFFRDMTAGGLVAGWQTALGFATVNVLVSAMVGAVALRHALHGHGLIVRAFASIGVLTGVGFLAAGHLLLVSLRLATAETGFLADGMAQAISRLVQTPFAWIDDLPSIFLLLLGSAITIVGMLKGYHAVGGPVPGQLPRHFAWQDAAAACDDLLDEALDQVIDSYDEALTELEDACDPLRTAAGRATLAAGRLGDLYAVIEEWPARSSHAVQRAHSIYRDEIGRIDALGAVFDISVEPERPTIPRIDTCRLAETGERLSAYQAKIKEMTALVDPDGQRMVLRSRLAAARTAFRMLVNPGRRAQRTRSETDARASFRFAAE